MRQNNVLVEFCDDDECVFNHVECVVECIAAGNEFGQFGAGDCVAAFGFSCEVECDVGIVGVLFCGGVTHYLKNPFSLSASR